jgi:signal transduction histidine kinase/ligand-binding sensor domain-containing protein
VEKKLTCLEGKRIYISFIMVNHRTGTAFQWLLFVMMTCMLTSIYSDSSAGDKYTIQEKRCPVKTVNYSQGLMNNSLTGIITDVLGFTWVSTSAGLQRFNGYTLQTITPVAGGDTIHINYPVHFLEGRNNCLLIGYRNGILEYNPESNSFRKLINTGKNNGSRYALMPIKLEQEGIWCFEEKKGMVIYNNSGVASASFPATQTANVEDMIRTEGYNITRRCVAVNENYIFIRVSLNSILQIDISTHKTKNIDYPGGGIIGLACNSNKIFVASKDGLASVNIQDGLISKTFLYKPLNDFPVTRSSIELSGDNRLLVTVERHLFEFDTSCICRKEIVSLNHDPLLKTGYIQIVYEDRFRRIWLLTHEDIKRIQNAETPFAQFIYAKEKDNFVRCIYYDKDKNFILAGAFAGFVQLYDSSGNALWDKPVGGDSLKGIMSIEKLSDDHYLVVILARGLYMLRLQAKQLYRLDLSNILSFQSDILQNSYSNNLQRVDDSTIYISTKSNVYRCEIQNNRFRTASPLLKAGLVDGYTVTNFLYTPGKILWVGTLSGVILKLDEAGAVKKIIIPENYVVRSMAEDGNHNIWVGTERGLFIYNGAGELLRSINREAGLLSDIIYALQPADKSNNNFFASTNFGLSFISKEGNIQNYTRELGLQENEFNTLASAISPSGKLFFGGINGITAFYPAELSRVRDSFLVSITRLVVNDSLYNLYGSEWKSDSIRLAYNQNHIQFDIAATGLLDPDEYLYKYRMKGFEKLSQTTNLATGIRYTLQPGSYTLEIGCSPMLFSGSMIQKKMVIIIDPPFWDTWWFILVSVLAAAIIIFSASYFVIWQRYQLKSRQLEMKQQMVNERERISRELHDNIGSQLSYISNNIDWLAETPKSFSREEETKRLMIVNDTAKNLVADLRETIWAMKKESIMLDELADKLKSFLQSQCILKPQMEVVITENIEKNYNFSPVEALNIFRTCQEAIVNSIRHSLAERLLFSIQSDTGKDFSFTIEDNGKGFDQQKHYQNHYGLENMKHRAKESGAKLLIRSVPGGGTSVSIIKVSTTGNQRQTD